MAKKKKLEKKHKTDPAHWLIKRIRTQMEHRKNCNSGYYKVSWPFAGIHHIVPVTSVSDPTIFDVLGDDFGNFLFIHYCLAETDWDIDDAHNTMGLPMKLAIVYRSSKRWNGYPCHDVDHNPHYTDGVSKNLNDQVWKPSIKKAEKCEFDPEKFKKELEGCSDSWREFLVGRGNYNGGTAFCWVNRKKIDDGQMSAPDKKPWYHPFSMHPDTPTKRKPPPDWKAFPGKLKAYLKEMFTIIK